jgi:hypothetical protein
VKYFSENEKLGDLGNDIIYGGFDNKLLKTIYVPKNLLYLTDRLPKSNYDGHKSVDGLMR